MSAFAGPRFSAVEIPPHGERATDREPDGPTAEQCDLEPQPPEGRHKPVPGAGERRFTIDELFFSATDAKGHVKFGNSVFSRIADYSLEEMVGRNHNIVRHPDMPRAVFKLLWDRLAEGKPTAAYVKNLAKDGRYYWVLALVYPAGSDYLSVRMKPTSDYLGVVAPLYERLRAIEIEIEGAAGVERKAAMQASGEALGATLEQLGFADYDAFMCQMFLSEVLSRTDILAARATPATSVLAGHHSRHDTALLEIGRSGASLSSFLTELLGNANHYERLNGDLRDSLTLMLSLADAINLFSLNATIASTRLGPAGVTLSTVSHHMRMQTSRTVQLIGEIKTEIEATLGLLAPLNFGIAGAKLQADMVADFVGELASADELEGEHDAGGRDSSAVAESFTKFVQGLLVSIHDVKGLLAEAKERFGKIVDSVNRLGQDLTVIKALEMNGRIESSHCAGSGQVRILFDEISGYVKDAQAALAQLAFVCQVRDQTDRIDFRDSELLLAQMSAATGELVGGAPAGDTPAR